MPVSWSSMRDLEPRRRRSRPGRAGRSAACARSLRLCRAKRCATVPDDGDEDEQRDGDARSTAAPAAAAGRDGAASRALHQEGRDVVEQRAAVELLGALDERAPRARRAHPSSPVHHRGQALAAEPGRARRRCGPRSGRRCRAAATSAPAACARRRPVDVVDDAERRLAVRRLERARSRRRDQQRRRVAGEAHGQRVARSGAIVTMQSVVNIHEKWRSWPCMTCSVGQELVDPVAADHERAPGDAQRIRRAPPRRARGR